MKVARGSDTLRRYGNGKSWGPLLAMLLSAICSVSATAQSAMVVTFPGQTFLNGVGNSGAPNAQTAGVSFNLTLTAVNSLNLISTGYSGTRTITYTGPGGAPLYTTNVTFANGQAIGIPTTLLRAQNTTISATDGALAATASSSISIKAGPFVKLQLLMPGESASAGTPSGKTGTPTAVVAGASFNFTVNAVDANWNIVSTNDTVSISSTDANGHLPANASLVGGTKTFGAMNRTAGLQKLTANDATSGGITANASPDYAVNAGSFARLLLLAPGENPTPGAGAGKAGQPSTQCAGVPFGVTVEAVDANWNLVTSAPANSIGITSSDTNALLPAVAALSNGVASFNLALSTGGAEFVMATNLTDGTKTSSQSSITVLAQQPQTISFSPLSNLVYGVPAIGLSATASSGLPVEFSVVSGPAAVNGTNLSISGAGTVAIQAAQPGNSQYASASNIVQTFAVSPAPLVVSSPNLSRFVGQTNPVFGGSVTGLQNGDEITAQFSVQATVGSRVGNYPIIATLWDPGGKIPNYTVSTNGVLSVNPLPLQWSAAHGGNGHYYQAMLAPGGISWDQAGLNATNAGGYLATITSGAENDFIFGLISKTPDYWISDSNGGDGPWIGGIKLPGPLSPTNWTWVTGEAFVFQNWAYAQPNNVNGYQNHIQFYSYSGLTANTWNDAADTLDEAYVPGYIIEYESDPYATNASNPAGGGSLTGIDITPGGHLEIHFSGPPNLSYTIQASTDLQNWAAIGSATTGANGQFEFEDTNAVNFAKRFYRTSQP